MMTRDEASQLLDAVRFGIVDATRAQITEALIATGDIPQLERSEIRVVEEQERQGETPRVIDARDCRPWASSLKP
mgnify:CR=1 FL=1